MQAERFVAEVQPAGDRSRPQTEALHARARGHDHHTVQFYEDDAFLSEVVADFAAAGLAAGDPVICVATAAHSEIFRRSLDARGVDVSQALNAGRLTLVDAHEALGQVMVGGQPDAARFQSLVGGLIQKNAGQGRLQIFGELVDLLCKAGQPEAALQLEGLWNDLAKTCSFSLLCGYAMEGFRRGTDSAPFLHICDAHTDVLPTESYSHLAEHTDRLREVTQLQQRARALETEIEHRKDVEIALRDAIAQRDEFLLMASHELRTPVTAAHLSIQSLAAHVETDQTRERLRRAERAITRLEKQIDTLFDASTMSAGSLELRTETVNLGELVRTVVEHLRTSHGCDVRLQADADVVGDWDRMRLEQVAGKLLENALKYGRTGPIEIEVGRTDAGARLVVRDQGIGISSDDQVRIFGRFERAVSARYFGGLGLGLYIVQQVVEAHAGRIHVVSEPNRGAAFIVELPWSRL